MKQNEITNLCSLLESQDNSNIHLALCTMQTLGVPAVLFSHVLMIEHYSPAFPLRKLAQHLIETYASEDFKNINHIINWKKSSLLATEAEATQWLWSLPNNTFLDIEVVIKMLLHFRRRGAYYALENKILEPEIVLNYFLLHQSLNLRSLGLGQLPEQISNYDYIDTLDLRGNPLETLPEGFFKLSQLKALYITPEEVNPKVLKKLNEFYTADVLQW